MRALVQPAAQGPRQPPHFTQPPHFAQPQQANFGHYPQASAFGHFSQGNQNSFSQQPHANNFSQPARAQTNVPRTSEARFNISNQSTAATFTNSAVGPAQPPPPQQQWQERPPNVCIFCSDPNHFQYACPTVADYISRGLCIRDGGQQLALPNGLRISPRVASGNNLKERVDAWHQQNPSPQRPVASTNLFSVLSPASDGPTDDPWAIFTHEISSSHVDTLDEPQDATPAAPSQRDLEEILVLQNLAASRARVTDEAPERARVAQFGPTTRAKAYNTPAAVLPPSRDAPPHMSKDPPLVPTPTSAAITPPKVAPGACTAHQPEPVHLQHTAVHVPYPN